MGKKGRWFFAVKKAFISDSKNNQPHLENTESKKWPGKEKDHNCNQVKCIEETEPDHDSNTLPTTDNADEVKITRYSGRSEEEIAAITIQAVFRGFLARRVTRAVRGRARLKCLIEGESVKRQSSETLKCIQNLAHLQSQVRARRIRMSEENQALHRQLQQKHKRELERMRMGKEWNNSTGSKEQMEANIQNKQDAATRRERALAYSYSHQAMKDTRPVNPSFMDPNNPRWGWSWLERWMSFRPWETRSTCVTEERKDKRTPTSSQKAGVSTLYPRGKGPTKMGSSNSTPKTTASGSKRPSQGYKRHSSGGTLAKEDESLANSSPAPSYMTPTKSTKARTKPASPLGILEKGSVKKRLLFPAAPPSRPRRHSVPGKIEGNYAKDGLNSQAKNKGTR